MKRILQSSLIGIPVLLMLAAILSKQGLPLLNFSPRTWLYVSISAVCVVFFWRLVERDFVPNEVVEPSRNEHPRWLIACLATIAFGLPLVVMIATVAQPWWEPGDLLRDPLNIVTRRINRTGSIADCCGSEVGAVSLLGNLITMAAAAIFGFAAIQRALTVGKLDGGVLLCLLGFCFATVITLDDLFRLHETHQRKFVAFYATSLGAIACLSWYWQKWFENSFLTATALFFVGSIVIDTVFEHHFGEYRVVIEDGLKLFGFCCLLAYSLTSGLRLALRAPNGTD